MKKKTRNVILGLLRDESMTGYEIKSCIDHRMSFFWQESFGQIYPELNAMIEEGLITENKEEQTDKRGKVWYSITEKGITAFREWMAADNEKDTIRSEALLKFFLADDEDREAVIDHLEQFYKENRERLALFCQLKESLLKFMDSHNNHKYIMKMLELGIKQQELYCSWSEDYLTEFKNETKKTEDEA